LKFVFIVDVDLDHAQLENHARRQDRPAAIVAEAAAEAVARITRALNGPAVLAVTVRTLVEQASAK